MADAGRPRPATRRRAGVCSRGGPSPRAAGWLGPGRGHRKQAKQLRQESRRSHSRSRIGGTHNQVEISRITTTLHRKHVQPQRGSASRAGRILSTATGRAGRLETLRNFSAKGYRFVVFGVYPDIRLSAGGGPQHMTVIQGTARAPQQVLARQDRPGLHAVVARVAVSLAVAVVAPAVLFWATLVTLDIDAAVIVALAWMVGAMCWRWATGGRCLGCSS